MDSPVKGEEWGEQEPGGEPVLKMLALSGRGEQDDGKSYKDQVKAMILFNIEKTNFV